MFSLYYVLYVAKLIDNFVQKNRSLELFYTVHFCSDSGAVLYCTLSVVTVVAISVVRVDLL